MGRPSYTPAQKNAINGRGGDMYVSAAAGSGKTAVLVERVVNRIADGGSVERLLIVTYTVSAAAEMRQRILDGLRRRLEKEPENRHLYRQSVLIPSARICTIDSFCGDLVRKNFHNLGISADFGIVVGAEYEIIRDAVLTDVLEEFYSKQDEKFALLVQNFGGTRDDSPLFNTLLRLEQSLSAHPDPGAWRKSAIMRFDKNKENYKDIVNTVKDYAKGSLSGLADRANNVMKDLLESGDDKLKGTVLTFMKARTELLYLLQTALDNWDINAYRSIIKEAGFPSFPTLRGYTENPLKIRAHSLCTEIKELLKAWEQKAFFADEADIKEDADRLYPIIRSLFDVEEAFETRLKERLLSQKLLSFPQVSRYALSLLVDDIDKETGKFTPSALAAELGNSFDEVMIDEYQDTNLLQNMIFHAVSDNGQKLFCVGDIKQSIYRFRQAMPEIFNEKKGMSKPFGEGFPALIHLSRNFRSRPGIIDFVNFFFAQVMSLHLGEMEYDSNERLTAGAEYPFAKEPEVEFHIINLEEDDEAPLQKDNQKDPADGEDSYDSTLLNARHTASYLKKLIDSGFMVYDRAADAMRPVNPGDCAVLLRSTSASGEVFQKELEKAGLPSFCESFNGFFESYEISMMLEVLSAIDNPQRDIPLAAALRSPLFGFSAETFACIRAGAENESLFDSLRRMAKDDGTCKKAFDKLMEYRIYARNMPVHRLIWHIYTDTGIMSLMAGLGRGAERQHNLRQLYSHAASYERVSAKGLAGFVRFIRRILESGNTLDGSKPSPPGQAVRVMTIHKSKGLEFPVVVLACCEKEFNTDDLRRPLYVHPKFGVGAVLRDQTRRIEYTTLFREAIGIQMKREQLSEEMRVLYVAMTRAREKLVLVAADKKLSSSLQKLKGKLPDSPVLDPCFLENQTSFYGWLLAAVLRHPDAKMLSEACGCFDYTLGEPGKISVLTVYPPAAEDTALAFEEKAKDITTVQPSEELIKEVRKRLTYKYPKAALAGVPAKVSVSELKGGRLPEEDASPYIKTVKRFTVPEFIMESGLNASQKGEAMHKFMQFSDFSLCEKGEIEKEINRLENLSYLFKEEADSLNREKLAAFFKTPLYSRMKKSNRIVREYRFLSEISASAAEPLLEDADKDEKVLLQGVIDCFFEEDGQIVLIDYKTDKTDETGELLVGRYKNQLTLYGDALEKIFNKPVKEMLIYSFYLGRSISISKE